MIELLNDASVWEEFLNYKLSHHLLTRQEEQYFSDYIKQKKYQTIADCILTGSYVFSCPKRSEINKLGTSKKRIVYSFSDDENMILKLLAYLLHRYDFCFEDNCYAFRCNTGAKKAFTDILQYPQIADLWCFQSDISNYFNSIDITLLEPLLYEVIEDTSVIHLLLALLKDDRALSEHGIIHESKGVMAGTPIASFLANLYLMPMDRYFSAHSVCYARYSDDILILAPKEQLLQYREFYHDYLQQHHLLVNPAKESLHAPGEAWSFLGFSNCNAQIDISPGTLKKILDRLRRSSHSLYRWSVKNNATPQRTLRAFIRKYNCKFYSTQSGHELCWARWYFPMITTTKSLQYIDEYMQDCLRYSVTGRHNKMNYKKVPYDLLRQCGYRPLVAEYYCKNSSY